MITQQKVLEKFHAEYEKLLEELNNTKDIRSSLNKQYHAMFVDPQNIHNILVDSKGKQITTDADSKKYKKQHSDFIYYLKKYTYNVDTVSFKTISSEELLELFNKNSALFFELDSVLLTKTYSQMSKLVSKLFTNDDIFGDHKFDVGHTFKEGSNTFTSPLSKKVDSITDFLYSNLSSLNAPIKVEAMHTTFIKEFEKIHYLTSRLVLDTDINDKLATLNAVLVIPQERLSNRELYSPKEKAAAKRLLDKLNRFVLKEASLLPESRKSPSFIEELEDTLVSAVLTGKVTKKKVTKSVTTTSKSKSKNRKIPVVNYRLRGIKGNFTSTVNIEKLIKSLLFETIKKNMASPALNYRTGRFARSVELKNLVYDNRSNQLTAFLTYMKYPYATFEPGGRMGSIDRSPTLLLDRSIREIAKSLTSARMKTVLV